jgi:hypothetical protein
MGIKFIDTIEVTYANIETQLIDYLYSKKIIERKWEFELIAWYKESPENNSTVVLLGSLDTVLKVNLSNFNDGYTFTSSILDYEHNPINFKRVYEKELFDFLWSISRSSYFENFIVHNHNLFFLKREEFLMLNPQTLFLNSKIIESLGRLKNKYFQIINKDKSQPYLLFSYSYSKDGGYLSEIDSSIYGEIHFNPTTTEAFALKNFQFHTELTSLK